VYADNVIEHLTLEQNRALLSEAFRVLKPGGRIRLVTPDIGELARLYIADPEQSKDLRTELQAEGYLVAHQVDVLRFAFQDDGHHAGYLWDADALAVELRRVGFTNLTICQAGKSEDPELCGLEARVGTPVAQICIIMEATKLDSPDQDN
jgi:predicted SAM-dependent methyltransferase